MYDGNALICQRWALINSNPLTSSSWWVRRCSLLPSKIYLSSFVCSIFLSPRVYKYVIFKLTATVLYTCLFDALFYAGVEKMFTRQKSKIDWADFYAPFGRNGAQKQRMCAKQPLSGNVEARWLVIWTTEYFYLLINHKVAGVHLFP